MIQPQQIIIADDHPLFRQALLDTLKVQLTHTGWREAETIEALEQQLHQCPEADLLLLDLHIPGAHGFNTLIHVRNHYPQIPVVVVSAHEDNETIGKAMEYGASGFVPKSTPVKEIFSAIQHVLGGEVWLPSSYTPITAPSESDGDIGERVASLTQQQYRILMMFAQGMLNKQIAYDLNVSEATIKAHATAIFRKLNVRNRTQAVIAISQLDLAELQIA